MLADNRPTAVLVPPLIADGLIDTTAVYSLTLPRGTVAVVAIAAAPADVASRNSACWRDMPAAPEYDEELSCHQLEAFDATLDNPCCVASSSYRVNSGLLLGPNDAEFEVPIIPTPWR